MIDKSITSIASKRCQIEIGEQNAQLQKQMTQLISDFNARGVLRSGAIMIKSSEICCDAIKARAQFVWQTYYRFISTTGVGYSDDLEEQLNALVASHFPEALGDIRGIFKQGAKHAGNDQLFDRFFKEMESARSTALNTIETEISLFVHSLRNKQQTDSDSSQTVVNVYSPVGNIQTGANSVANISQAIDTESKERIIAALSEIKVAIDGLGESYAINKDEVEELVTESSQELEKDKPNSLKVRGLLSGIAASIQTTASLKPAYESLKVAAGFIGISLP
jgi:hypothetical protein